MNHNHVLCICSNFNCENQYLTTPHSGCTICGYVMEPIDEWSNLTNELYEEHDE